MNLHSHIADHILNIQLPHPVRVGINGIDGSGKTMFTAKLVEALRPKTDRQIIAASIDHFHQSKSVRYQQGRDSAIGYYEDSFQYEALRRVLLDPLSTHGNRRFRTQLFDLETDQLVQQGTQVAADDAILILEGIFLFRPELVDQFDYKIFIDVPFEITLQRMLTRDVSDPAQRAEAIERFHKRYKAGQELYLQAVQPQALSDIVIDNSDFDEPVIRKWRG